MPGWGDLITFLVIKSFTSVLNSTKSLAGLCARGPTSDLDGDINACVGAFLVFFVLIEIQENHLENRNLDPYNLKFLKQILQKTKIERNSLK